MNDVIELELITSGEAEGLRKLQVEAFIALYEKYRDDITSPAKESLEKITQKIIEDNSDFYFILFNGKRVGGVRVKWHKGQKVHKNVNWISPIFIITEFQNKKRSYCTVMHNAAGGHTLLGGISVTIRASADSSLETARENR